MNGAELIAAERERQVREKGHTALIDDGHEQGELLECAADIIVRVQEENWSAKPMPEWVEQRGLHVTEKYAIDYVRRLVIAGALIAAEVDRLLRLNERQREPSAGPPAA